MKIRYISVKRFRGIRELDWSIPGDVICLIGPGDSTKTTILDAIDFALSPRWDIPINDSDFYLGVTNDPIEITVTVGQLPNKLLDDKKFGLQLRGWNKNTGINDEPQEGDEGVLSIRLAVESSLEPIWSVFTERQTDVRHISYQDREMLGAARLGSYFDRQFSWSRGSSLSRLTGELGDVPRILAEANRKARQSVTSEKLPSLQEAANKAQESAKSVGLKPKGQYRPALDIQTVSVSGGSLILYDDNVPVRSLGLGSRRLLALGIQRSSIRDGAIMLVDEVEQGLEPHRLRHLVRQLRPTSLNESTETQGQIFLTTHSPIALVELKANELYVVRSSEDGVTSIRQVEDVLQNTIRSSPETLLGRKVIVCEGKTEYGFCRALDQLWSKEEQNESMSFLGVVPSLPAQGGGPNSMKAAVDLSTLGYATALICDSDEPITEAQRESLLKSKVFLIEWADGCSIEQRLSKDLPVDGLQSLIEIALKIKAEEPTSVLDSLKSMLGIDDKYFEGKIGHLLANNIAEEKIRQAIGDTAKKKSWFKRIDYGEMLGEVVLRYLPSIPDSDTAKKIALLKEWIYSSG